MCTLEALSVCSSVRSPLAGKPGLPGAVSLTPPEVMATLSSLPWEQQAAAGAILWGEKTSIVLLWGWLNQVAAQREAAEGWKECKGRAMAPWLAKIAVEDLLSPQPDPNQTTAALRLGMSRSTYLRGWSQRHAWLVRQGRQLAAQAAASLGREIYEHHGLE